jgi:hypothetical protein
MPECWFSMLPDAGPCDGRLRQCHLLPKNKIAQEFPRGAWRSQGESSWRPLGRNDDLRLDELGLEWWLDYTYGPRWDDEAERAAREAHDDVPLP